MVALRIDGATISWWREWYIFLHLRHQIWIGHEWPTECHYKDFVSISSVYCFTSRCMVVVESIITRLATTVAHTTATRIQVTSDIRALLLLVYISPPLSTLSHVSSTVVNMNLTRVEASSIITLTERNISRPSASDHVANCNQPNPNLCTRAHVSKKSA
jgi:hypothetical protein